MTDRPPDSHVDQDAEARHDALLSLHALSGHSKISIPRSFPGSVRPRRPLPCEYSPRLRSKRYLSRLAWPSSMNWYGLGYLSTSPMKPSTASWRNPWRRRGALTSINF